jgi:3-methyl-2-oxobutanoate hydroxymethyltransferase
MKLGGYAVQGREEAAAQRLFDDALAVAAAGAELLVLECVPSGIARRISEALEIPTIGIGAGPGCDGQVLVLHDMLGLTYGDAPRFVRNFLDGGGNVADAVRRYVAAVKGGEFPDDALHGF